MANSDRMAPFLFNELLHCLLSGLGPACETSRGRASRREEEAPEERDVLGTSDEQRESLCGGPERAGSVIGDEVMEASQGGSSLKFILRVMGRHSGNFKQQRVWSR